MRLQNRALHFVVNFLLGIAWASVLIGAVTSFLTFYHDSFLYACIYAGIGMIPGMVGVLLLEHFITTKEQYEELVKQTELLEVLISNQQ